MKLYTRTGDSGDTSLLDGTRVPKDHPRVAACGDVDEVSSLLGWCACADAGSAVRVRVQMIQCELFVMGAELATPPDSKRAGKLAGVGLEDCRRLEGWIDEATESVPPLRNFILAGGTELASRLHLARTVCRRAERAIVALARCSPVRPEVVVYLNRLSDLLFAWARLANQGAGVPDVPWIPDP